MWTARVLLAAVLVVCVGFSADARRRHHGYYGGEGYFCPSPPAPWAARPQPGRNREATGDPSGGQAQGDDRRQTGTRDSGQSRGRDPDRWQDRRDYRSRYGGDYQSRYERRRARSLEEWRRTREREDATRTRETGSRDAARG